MKKATIAAAIAISLVACTNQKNIYDASGTFEAVETIVSAEASGKILNLDIWEGQQLKENTVIGNIDPVSLSLQKDEINSSISALYKKTSDVSPQVKLLQQQLSVQQSQLDNL